MDNSKFKSGEQSIYDPSRASVGKIYRDLQINSNPQYIEVGDMTREIMKGYVEDLNDGIKDGIKVFDGDPFYVMIHEKKDQQMPTAMLRRVLKQRKRPYPEDDMDVFWHNPKTQQTCFCWSLPHWSNMYNILANANLFDKALVQSCLAWRRHDLYFFGFTKDDIGNWMPNPNWKDKDINEFRRAA